MLGGGSWGTVLAHLASLNGYEVTLWMRDEDLANQINTEKINGNYLPGLSLKDNLVATSAIQEISNSNSIIYCIPSDAFREVAISAEPYISVETNLVSATKGVESSGFNLMSKILSEIHPENPIGVISGPNLAEEIASSQLSGTVIASTYKNLRKDMVDILSSDFFRVYENTDPYGVEMGGALKNIYAIACGIADGLNSGENTIGMMMTRGLGEMSRLAANLGANPQTFLGLAGVGDLITTCASPLSRNHQFGKFIGNGSSIDEAKMQIGQTIEGLKTLKVVKEVSDKKNVEMPIVDSLYKIIYKGESLNGSIQKVLGKDMSDEDLIDKEEWKDNLLKQGKWIRLFWMLAFSFVYYLSMTVLWLIVSLQFLFVLITDKRSHNIEKVSLGFRNYMVQILDYLTYHSSEKPFPFSDFPTEENDK